MQSRLAHETGLRHKGNYDRKIRELYKKSERASKEAEAEAREIARMEAVSRSALLLDKQEGVRFTDRAVC